ncbi:MAG: TetR/AcrR family transcriptional regulator [Planctomycetota bacterium]|jgi:AcrR family transcriptional regulator
MPKQESRPRLDRSNWLDAALDVLYQDGLDAVRIDGLAKALGVTKGSFYHHFRDRDDLLTGMVQRWRGRQEGFLNMLREMAPEDAKEHLAMVIDFTVRKDSSHDLAIRVWARSNAHARSALQAVDQARLDLLEEIFRRLGFRGDEMKLRARMLYYYQVGDHSLSVKDPEKLRQRLGKLRLEMLVS